MSAITSSNVAQAIVKLVASEALAPLVGKLVFGNIVNRDYEPVLAQAGDTVNVPIPPTLVANNIAEAGTVQTQNPNLGNAQIVLNTHCEATFQIPDVTKVLAVPDLVKTYMQPAIIAIATKVETDLASLYSLFTYNTPTGGATAMDESRVDSAEITLFNSLVPDSSQKFMVVSGKAYGELRQLSRFTDYETVGPSGQPSAQITGMLPGGQVLNADGKLKDFLVFRSQYIQRPSTTTYNLGFAKDAIGLVIRRLPMPLPGTGAIAEYAEMGNFGLRVVMSYQPNTLAQQFTVDVLYGCAVLRNNFGIQIQSD
jgi:hypothetical protein